MQLLQLPPHHLLHADDAAIAEQLNQINAGGVGWQDDLHRLQRRAMAHLNGWWFMELLHVAVFVNNSARDTAGAGHDFDGVELALASLDVL